MYPKDRILGQTSGTQLARRAGRAGRVRPDTEEPGRAGGVHTPIHGLSAGSRPSANNSRLPRSWATNRAERHLRPA